MSAQAEQALERAWDALDAGDLDTALAAAAEAGDGQRGAWLVRACAWTETGELARAEAALARAEGLPGPAADLDLEWARAELSLRAWRHEEARAAYERIARLEREPAVLGRLALCWELAGDLARADGLLAEAQRIDPQGWPAPLRLSDAEFEALLDEAIARLPAAFQEALHDTQILVEAVPGRDLIEPSAPQETPPDLLGLFVGPSRLERSVEDSLALPPTILLFQRNLERAAADREELVSEIRVTLFHEIGHMLGFDEEGVEELGLE